MWMDGWGAILRGGYMEGESAINMWPPAGDSEIPPCVGMPYFFLNRLGEM